MPVPMTTAMLLAAFIFAYVDDPTCDIAAVVIVALGVLNQAIVSFSNSTQQPPREEEY